MMQDDDDDDDDNDDSMILNNRAKSHTSERTIVPWTVIFKTVRPHDFKYRGTLYICFRFSGWYSRVAGRAFKGKLLGKKNIKLVIHGNWGAR